ncbi:MAG: hypothetical protein IPP31_06065 [Chitinophagaceae bacterium]|nr:hypothetical protein [Chitinophagaceae bacterium]
MVVPIGRQLFHDRIREEQKILDRADGRSDKKLKVTGNEEINTAVTEMMMKRVDELADSIELNKKIPGQAEKVKYLSYLTNLVRSYRTGWKSKQLNPAYAPILVNGFEKAMNLTIDSLSMAPMIDAFSYESGKILVDLFKENTGWKESKMILFLKFCKAYPDRIMQHIEPYADEPFADSLVVLSGRRNPTAIYSVSQSVNSTLGKLVRRNTHPLISTIVRLSNSPNALLYFPFLDDILNGRQTMEDIGKYLGEGDAGYDSVGYFKLLVQTEISYYKRMISPARDTPIAQFGANGLREMLQKKALQHFINPINELHEKPENVRMRPVEPLSSIDLYYMMVMGETDIYTSSYKYSFARMMQRLGRNPRTDSLLLLVQFDYFKKFIKMAANFNKLDEFLRAMPASRSQLVMKAFVANLDNTGNLEDAVDVADAYGSITDKKLMQNILFNVEENEKSCIQNNNKRGKLIYGLLKKIFRSADSSNSKTDVFREMGLRTIYSVEPANLADDSGRIIEQVFFYGDQDGIGVFSGFVNSFSRKDWSVNMKPEWVEIRSLRGKKIWIFANRPLDNDSNLDDSAQLHLNKYLQQNDLRPSIVVHRGHSYWLPRTLKRMPYDAGIVLLGSCGGYKNLSDILYASPDAHIISTKEIGRGDINKPIVNYLHQTLLDGKPLVWKTMWSTLTKQFAGADKATRDSWQDYIPPYKNLGAIFIKAYNKLTEKE